MRAYNPSEHAADTEASDGQRTETSRCPVPHDDDAPDLPGARHTRAIAWTPEGQAAAATGRDARR